MEEVKAELWKKSWGLLGSLGEAEERRSASLSPRGLGRLSGRPPRCDPPRPLALKSPSFAGGQLSRCRCRFFAAPTNVYPAT
jgi:hypothetical protein